jgi:hypothetical protein
MATTTTADQTKTGRTIVIHTRFGVAELDLHAMRRKSWEQSGLAAASWTPGLSFAGWVVIYRLTI